MAHPRALATIGPRAQVCAAALAAAAALVLGGGSAEAAIVAGSADDICAPAVDPCVITQQVDVVAGSTLDFGVRAVVLQGSGVLNFGTGSAVVLCGDFSATSSGASVTARGGDGSGGTAGGTVQVLSRRRCSGASSLACFVDADCAAVGAGSCTGGVGGITLTGKVLGNADVAAHLTLKAAGDVRIDKLVTAAGTLGGADGGEITVESTQGSIAGSDKLDVSSGGQASGGDLTITAAVDIALDGILDANGGDFDGGSIALSAGRDVTLTQDVTANSVSGAGFGGSIDVAADRDISLLGGTQLNRQNLATDGHQSIENYAGDGGTQSYDAGGAIRVSRYVRMDSNGAAPDGFGDAITFAAGLGVSIDGIVSSKAKGGMGGGGSVEVACDGDLVLSSTSLIDVTGYSGGGGDVSLTPAGNLTADGDIEAGAGSGGPAGEVLVRAGGDASIGGSVASGGDGWSAAYEQLHIEACRVHVSGTLTNGSTAGGNELVGREHIKVLAGGQVTASGAGGGNTLRYRTAAKPPQILGTVSPAALLVVDDALVGCPVCGNGETDQGETCDDGGTADGDGCSADCQDEGCIAQSPGYPSVALCDDANECTDDACDAAGHTCTHTVGSCSDGIPCTVDACDGTLCTHTPTSSDCADANPCTLDLCSTLVGCLHVAQEGSCEDGVFCNGTDSCAGGACSVHSGDPCASGGECADLCNEILASCSDPAGTPCTEDAEICTDDVCDGAGACSHPPNSASCDDGLFCDGTDTCAAGACSVHSGDPCTAGPDCRRTCNEVSDSCRDPAGTACSDDGNVCTGDLCDAAGSCTHPAVSGACDDFDFCTVDDLCQDGLCVATPAPELAVAAVKVSLRGGFAEDRMVLKGSMPLGALELSPSDVAVRLVVGDATGGSLFDGTVPAGSFVDVRSGGNVFRFRAASASDADGIVKATFKKVATKGIVRLRFKMDAVDLSAMAGQPALSVALLEGDTPGVSPCASAADLPCVARTKRLSCKPR